MTLPIFVVLCFWCSTVLAVSIHPEIKQQLIAEGRWQDVLTLMHAARAAGMDAGVARQTHSLAAGAQGTEFGSRIPCILVEFSDNLWAGGSVNTSKGRIDTMLFSEGFLLSTGSMRDYYLENSYGTFDVEGVVVGPVMMPRTYAYYIRDSAGISKTLPNARTLASDAVVAANSLIDFAQFDANNDGFVDGVMVICAGYGAEESGEMSKIQSHQWTMPAGVPVDGKTAVEYTMQPEEHGPFLGGGTNGMGVMSHEWGHVLGLIDLYDVDYSSWGIGNWSLMGSGNYMNQSRTPVHMDPWSKAYLKWLTIDTVPANRVNQPIATYATSPTIFRLWIPGLSGSEYFLLCNRRKTNFDTFVPGSGLMILHIDEFKSDNTLEYNPQNPAFYHYKVAVVQADGNYDLEDSVNTGDAGDVYTNLTQEFDDLTDPSSRRYSGAKTQVAVWNISAPGATMTANLDVTFSRPRLQLVGHTFTEISGDGDDVPDPGETVMLTLATLNQWKATYDISVEVTCSSPAVSFMDNIVPVEPLSSGAYAYPTLTFSVAAGTQPTIADFYIDYACEGGAFTFADTVRADLGPKQVLLVDGDANYGGGLANYQMYYLEALENLRVPYGVHDKKTSGAPSAAVLQQYPMALWWTGNQRPPPIAAGDSVITHADVVSLKTYLDGGGRLFMTGQDIAQSLSTSADSLFAPTYLGARFTGSTPLPVFASGLAGDPIGENLTLVIQGSGGAANQSDPDNLNPVPGASASFRYSSDFPPLPDGGVSAVTYSAGAFKAVFWGFGFEAVTDIGLGVPWPPYDVTREQILSRVLSWLVDLQTGILEEEDVAGNDGNGSGIPSRFSLFQNYPNPFNGQTTIEFAVSDGAPAVVALEVFDILGRKVTTLLDGMVGAGRHQVSWDGYDRHGRQAASGVYFYRVSTNAGQAESRHMVYLK